MDCVSSQAARHVVLTGITSGLGLALTRELLRSGQVVTGCGRRADPLNPAERDAAAGRYSFAQLDVRDTDAVRAWAAAVAAERPPIDCLVHNAAVIHPTAPLWEINPALLDQVMAINVQGTIHVLQAFLPPMVAARRGVIVTLSSGAGRQGFAGLSGYCASKWAVEGLTRSLAAELPEGMAAIPLSPGMVDTAMLRTSMGEAAAADQASPAAWARTAAPYILRLGPAQNGQPLTIEVGGEA